MPKQTTDTRLSVDVRELLRQMRRSGGNEVLVRWQHERTDPLPVLTLFTQTSPETISVRHVKGGMPAEVLDITHTPCRFGGTRAWFQCSKLGCGQRVAVLYDTPRGFRCRHCAHLDYRSHRERDWDRLLRRSRRLRAKVGGGANLVEPFPARPKGMHWATYHRLAKSETVLWDEASQQAMNHISGLTYRQP
jgi:hypothetical protein